MAKKKGIEVRFSEKHRAYFRDLVERGDYGLDDGEVVRNLVRLGIQRVIAEADLAKRDERHPPEDESADS